MIAPSQGFPGSHLVLSSETPTTFPAKRQLQETFAGKENGVQFLIQLCDAMKLLFEGERGQFMLHKQRGPPITYGK